MNPNRKKSNDPLLPAARSLSRCPWPGQDPLMIAYHDTEWGAPLHDDLKLYEFLVLEAMQAGLSWAIVLHKREGFRRAFEGMDPAVVARYTAKEIERLVKTPGIIRNRLKIEAAVTNARKFLEVRDEFGSFDNYVWQFVSGKPIENRFSTPSEIPATSPEAVILSKDMRMRGFKFMGPTVVYAHMQATGMVNDHLLTCFRHREICAFCGGKTHKRK